jgi:F-type H+-transporting ATPase subunit delta
MDKYTIAYPYAKAIFETAIKDNAIQQWSQVLTNLKVIVQEKTFANFVTSPAISHKQRENLLADIGEQFLGNAGKNFMRILAENHRLDVFSELATIYEQLRAEYENIVSVEAVSAYALTETQQTKLETALQKRLQKKIALHYKVDESLLGGVTIYIGDSIIDGSLRNKLNRLRNLLLT